MSVIQCAGGLIQLHHCQLKLRLELSHTNSESIQLLEHHSLVFGPCDAETILCEQSIDSLLELWKVWELMYRPSQGRDRAACAGNLWTQSSEHSAECTRTTDDLRRRWMDISLWHAEPRSRPKLEKSQSGLAAVVTERRNVCPPSGGISLVWALTRSGE